MQNRFWLLHIISLFPNSLSLLTFVKNCNIYGNNQNVFKINVDL